nr:hypothetical protein [Candidatus Sigynarchaeum springense]
MAPCINREQEFAQGRTVLFDDCLVYVKAGPLQRFHVAAFKDSMYLGEDLLYNIALIQS